ncbi:hypothetical protein HAX54_025905 [Datura stramonium]|uniref:Uncharacterized protein n=1 Tax=Datura stramonium TaxID=4076 RepID=A0ABS8V2H7_DATST|nr:hypothetical protein [Datura stramonium]
MLLLIFGVLDMKKSGKWMVEGFQSGRRGAMALRANKGKEVATSSKVFKRLRKGFAPSSSAPKAPPVGGSEPKLLRSTN